jgi:hypothetical protein
MIRGTAAPWIAVGAGTNDADADRLMVDGSARGSLLLGLNVSTSMT